MSLGSSPPTDDEGVAGVDDPTVPRPAPDAVHIVEDRRSDVILLTVSGELDAVSAPRLGRHLEGLDLAEEQVVYLDLAAVSFIDSSGLRELVAPVRGLIRVSAASDVVRRILEITGLEEMMSPPPS